MTTTTLIQRLRDWRGDPDEVMSEAADALEQQAAQIAEKDAEIARLRDIARDASDAATKHQSIVLTQATRIEALRAAIVVAIEALEWHASNCCEDSIPQTTVDALAALR